MHERLARWPEMERNCSQAISIDEKRAVAHARRGKALYEVHQIFATCMSARKGHIHMVITCHIEEVTEYGVHMSVYGIELVVTVEDDST